MTLRVLLSQQELCSSNPLFNFTRYPKRNLGCAILVAAIEDYRGLDDQAHASAALFLFPSNPEYRKHYDWAVAMARGVNPAWLRCALDRVRQPWDRERSEQKLRARLDSSLRKIDFAAGRDSSSSRAPNIERVSASGFPGESHYLDPGPQIALSPEF